MSVGLQLFVPPRRRVLDWETRWAALLAHMERRPFAWGVADCCTFAAANVEALTGVAPMRFSEAWKTQGQALWEVIHQGGIRFALGHLFGDPLLTPLLAQRGDLVLIEQVADPSWPGLAVCEAGTWCAPGPLGLQRGPIEQAQTAWPVGREA